jgi:hypothetical protein
MAEFAFPRALLVGLKPGDQNQLVCGVSEIWLVSGLPYAELHYLLWTLAAHD